MPHMKKPKLNITYYPNIFTQEILGVDELSQELEQDFDIQIDSPQGGLGGGLEFFMDFFFDNPVGEYILESSVIYGAKKAFQAFQKKNTNEYVYLGHCNLKFNDIEFKIISYNDKILDKSYNDIVEKGKEYISSGIINIASVSSITFSLHSQVDSDYFIRFYGLYPMSFFGNVLLDKKGKPISMNKNHYFKYWGLEYKSGSKGVLDVVNKYIIDTIW